MYFAFILLVCAFVATATLMYRTIEKLRDELYVLKHELNNAKGVIESHGIKIMAINTAVSVLREKTDAIAKEAEENAAEQRKTEREYKDHLDGINSIMNYTYDVALGAK